ncbi:MAG TPA: hypothetical protein VME70_11945 [Mycobacteriales bacterium]|nr:hypothetical protein [Mycobacteriales bacterium]
MIDLDELLRETLAGDVEGVALPLDLAEIATRRGQRIRRRRRTLTTAAATGSAGAVVVGAVAISAWAGRPAHSQVLLGSRPSEPPVTRPSQASHHHDAGLVWTNWPTDRRFGTAPSQAFLDAVDPGQPQTVYAEGTMSDGTEFVVSDPTADRGEVPGFVQGWNNVTDFGESVSVGPSMTDGSYLAFQTPTYDAGDLDTATTQWLVVVGAPDTRTASYSADGTSWTSMSVQEGIAVLKLPAIAPVDAQIRLTDGSGHTVQGGLGVTGPVASPSADSSPTATGPSSAP